MNLNDFRMPENLSLRPAREGDRDFFTTLYWSTRDDLRLVDAEPDLVESLIDMQYRAQKAGYGTQFPNALYFVVEHAAERIGRIILDFGASEVRIVDIAFVPAARRKGFGTQVFRALQAAASQVRAPLTLTVHPLNVTARRLYAALGFRTLEFHPIAERLVWYPEGYPTIA